MQQKMINPWQWQDRLGFSQAVEVSGTHRMLYCAGQTSLDAEGQPLHAGDMRAQVVQAMDNLQAVLNFSGFDLTNVVRLNYYTTDVEAFLQAYDAVVGRLQAAGCQPASTLLGITRLAFPELLVEIEATAIR